MRILTIATILLCAYTADSQIFLQLERGGKLKTDRWHYGDELSFQTRAGGAIWYHRRLGDMDRASGSLYLDGGFIRLDDITAVRTYRNRGWSSALGKSLLYFGGGWLAWTALGSLSDPDVVDWKQAALIGTGSAALGLTLRWSFASERYRLGDRHHLRIIEIAF